MLVTMAQAEQFRRDDALTARELLVGDVYGLTTGRATAGEALESTLAKAGADFRVERVPLFTPEGFAAVKSHNKGRMGTAEHKSGAAFYGVRKVGAVDGSMWQVVGPQYRPVQNMEAGDILAPLIDAGVVSLDGALVLRGGGMVVLRGKVNGDLLVRGDRAPLQAYFNVAVPHDGTLALNAYLTTVRPVCENTLAAGLLEAKGKGERVSIRHTIGAQERIQVAKALASEGVAAFQRFADKANRMAALPVGDRAFETALARFLPEEGGEPTKATVAARDVVRGLWAGDTVGARGTAWAALQAFTEYADHHTRIQGKGLDARELAAKRADSALFGRAAEMKREAAAIILDVVGELV